MICCIHEHPCSFPLPLPGSEPYGTGRPRVMLRAKLYTAGEKTAMVAGIPFTEAPSTALAQISPVRRQTAGGYLSISPETA